MAINYPTSLDLFTDPTASDQLNLPSHSGLHTDINSAVEALEAKVGADSSAVTSSLDYKVAQLEAQGVRTTYTPASYTNITVGNGTEIAAYVLNGDVMTVDYVLVFGSTTSIDGSNPVFALPSGYSRATGYDIPCGLAQLRDQGTRTYYGFAQTNANGLSIHTGSADVTTLYQHVVSPTFPFTWTTTDAIRLTATFQVTTT